MQSVSFWLQSGSSALAFGGAGVMAHLAAKRHKNTAFSLLAATFFIDAFIGILTMFFFGLNPHPGGSVTFYQYIQTPLRIISLLLMLLGWAMLAFDWKPSLVLSGPANVNASSPQKAGRIASVLAFICSFPAAGWAFLMLLASGMKSAPHLSPEDALLGAVPALVILLLSGALMIFKQKLGLTLGYMITLAVGALLCAGGLLVVMMGYVAQA